MPSAREIYAASALRSIPRLLSLLDRNPFSPSYGCFHRDYWLYKTSDFPDAVRQFGVHALALVYTHDLPGNVYRGNANIRQWAIAALNFWAKIQHADGSFDEFYPYERGWVGPTAFTTYTSSEAYRLLRTTPTSEVSEPLETSEVGARVRAAIRRAARFIAAGETEEDHLANHHAMAYLAVSTAADVLDDASLRAKLPGLWQSFLRYQHEEGWSREYDGADPGYLSATISFLAKVYKGSGQWAVGSRDEFRRVLTRAVEFASYFVYPDGSYAGTIGSRNTLHCYPHGFEILGSELPMAAAIAERTARGLADGKLVPPEIMSDRYVHYRVPEFLLAAIDARPRTGVLAQLPFERPPFARVFPGAGTAAAVHGPAYTVANLRKGGVVKSFDRTTGRAFVQDTGWVGETSDGRVVTSQWIDPAHDVAANEGVWSVAGSLNVVPSAKLFTIWTHLAFRIALALLGWHPGAAHWLKGKIRTSLILGTRRIPCRFRRTLRLTERGLELTDELENPQRIAFRRLLLGGDFPLRYVPQSRFFQPAELEAKARELTSEEIAQINRGEVLRVARTFLTERHPEEEAPTKDPTRVDPSLRSG